MYNIPLEETVKEEDNLFDLVQFISFTLYHRLMQFKCTK